MTAAGKNKGQFQARIKYPYRYQRICLLLLTIDTEVSIVVAIFSCQQTLLLLLFSWDGKQNVDSDSGGLVQVIIN